METIKEHIEEARLYPQKWFDYRAVSPEGCDLIFISEWLRVHADHEKRDKLFVDLDGEGREVLPRPWRGFREMRHDRDFVTLMRGLRRLCDRKGYRYDRWWVFAYQALLDSPVRSLAGAFAQFSSAAFKGSVVDLYEDHRSQFIDFSQCLSKRNYTGATWQREYFAYIEAETKKRYPKTWHELLSKLEEHGIYVPVDKPVE